MKSAFAATMLFLFAFGTFCFAKELPTISFNELGSDAQLIDTRSEELYIGWKNKNGVSGHIKGATDFPAQWLDYEPNKDKISVELKRRGIDKSKKTVLYADDDLSEAVYDKFKEQGFLNLYALKGGINANSKELERLKGYETYVSAQWVQDLLDGKKVESYNGERYVILEISLPSEKDEYKSGHIKGAINLSSDDINHIAGSRTMQEYENIPLEKQLKFWGFPSDDHIKEVLENAGINEDTLVILYATTKATTAANRTALVMDYAGVKNIKFLNGGKTIWKLENRPLEAGIVTLQKAKFGVQIPKNPNVVFTYEQERKLVDDKNAVIASVRSFDEYLGKKSGYTYIDKAGDVANSRFAYAGSNPYAMEDFRNLDNTMFNYKIIDERWKLWGITPEKTVSFHCGTGWRAAEAYYIAKALGWPRVGVYVGGWYEWSKKDGSPVKEKGLPKDAPEKEPQEFFN
ncbi:rhodanese-like domain-containing protein [Campylobacter concisus]|uniref:rhodanese-like domain-containing protein n=1 Tax=Campylobacter concisus TaxID=199 RepID=UPI000D30B09F|nr:rhodanese-like domain-containing protein [Campylobacter concisus]